MVTRRRTKGEGSITKTNTGKYRVRVDCGYINGTRKQLSATLSTYIEAKLKLREFEKQRDTYNIPLSREMTFKKLFDNFLENRKKRYEIKDTTITNYLAMYRTLPNSFTSSSISHITTATIDRYIIILRGRHNKETTIAARLLSLSSIFNYAIKELKILASNPIQGCIKVTKKPQKLSMDVLSDDEFLKIRTNLHKHYEACVTSKAQQSSTKALFYIAFLIAYELGLRRGEILGLRWSRINFEDHTLFVDNQLQHTKEKGFYNTTPKTTTSNRLLIVSKGLIDILRRHRMLYPCDSDYIFTRNNRHLGMESLNNLLHATLKEVGILRPFTFHMLRHTNATKLIERTGNDYKTVSERLGHSSVTMTFNVYAHAIKKHHQLAANLMDCTQ